jgi:hypothetical protein
VPKMPHSIKPEAWCARIVVKLLEISQVFWKAGMGITQK